MEEKKTKKKINWHLISMMLDGKKRYLIFGVISMLFAVASGYCIPLITGFTVDFVIGNKPETVPAFLMDFINRIGGREYLVENIIWCAAALVALTLINCLSTYLKGRSVAYASDGIAKTLKDTLYKHLQDVPYDYHKHASTGDLVQRCTSDVDTVRRFVAVQLLEVARTVGMVVFACAIMFSLNVKMAWISVISLPVMLLVSMVYFRYVLKYFGASDEAEGKMSATLQENLTGVRVVRAFGQQQSEVEKFTKCNDEYKTVTYKLIKLLGMYWGGTDMIGYAQIILTLSVGIYMAASTKEITLGQLTVFVSYVGMLTWPVRQLGRVLADMGKATVSLGRIDDILSTPAEKEPGSALTPEIKGSIEFKNVCFGYDAYNDVLDDISFRAEPGKTIAILGATGSGKTSLVQLLQRLYLCTEGTIEIDGININDIESGHLRKNIGLVLQEPFLYSRTVKENIGIVNPDAPDEDIFAVARVAAIHDVIMAFKEGYDTIIGERGVTLSGGQKQRVAIARTLMQKAPILIFDDSMSAVDTETDAAIRDALNARKSSSTTFLISHRITTLSRADKILVLEKGRLVQSGTHEELLQVDGLYKRIAQIQNLLEDDLRNEEGDEA